MAGFIHNRGLLESNSVGQLDTAFRLYRDRTDAGNPTSTAALAFQERYSYRPDTGFIGVRDTVGSLGVPVARWKLFGWVGSSSEQSHCFHEESLSSIVKHAYRAISIHEHRGTFP